MQQGDVFRELAQEARTMVREGCDNAAGMLAYAASLEQLGRMVDHAGLPPSRVRRMRPSRLPRRSAST